MLGTHREPPVGWAISISLSRPLVSRGNNPALVSRLSSQSRLDLEAGGKLCRRGGALSLPIALSLGLPRFGQLRKI